MSLVTSGPAVSCVCPAYPKILTQHTSERCKQGRVHHLGIPPGGGALYDGHVQAGRPLRQLLLLVAPQQIQHLLRPLLPKGRRGQALRQRIVRAASGPPAGPAVLIPHAPPCAEAGAHAGLVSRPPLEGRPAVPVEASSRRAGALRHGGADGGARPGAQTRGAAAAGAGGATRRGGQALAGRGGAGAGGGGGGGRGLAWGARAGVSSEEAGAGDTVSHSTEFL